MRHSPWRPFVQGIVVLAIAMVAGGFFLQRRLARSLESLLKAENLRAAWLVARLVDGRTETRMTAAEAAKLADARVTVIELDGKVLADSAADPAGMDKHADRTEVRAALADGEGHAIRRSGTVQTEMLYTAVRVDGAGKGPPVFVRLAREMKHVRDLTTSFRDLLWTGLVLLVLLGVLVCYFFIELRIAREADLLRESREKDV